MREPVEKLWPELDWIGDEQLRESVRQTWVRAFEDSPLAPSDLEEIPFTLLIPGCPATFMEHKRCVVHIARRSAEAMDEFLGRALPIDMDVVVAGAILADVGKLLEYEVVDGQAVQSDRGRSAHRRGRHRAWNRCESRPAGPAGCVEGLGPAVASDRGDQSRGRAVLRRQAEEGAGHRQSSGGDQVGRRYPHRCRLSGRAVNRRASVSGSEWFRQLKEKREASFASLLVCSTSERQAGISSGSSTGAVSSATRSSRGTNGRFVAPR